MKKQIKVIVKRPQEKPQVIEIADTLQTWQGLVGGYIEAVPYTRDGKILVICNEDGKLMNLKPNLPYGNDILVGTIVFVGNDAPEFRSLTEEEIQFVMYQTTSFEF